MLEKYALCLEVLKRLNKASVLKHVIITGSWCLYFYKEHLFPKYDISRLRTRDIDFLVPTPTTFKEKVDVPALLKDLGFIITFTDSLGHLRLEHPDLLIDFLVPETGRGRRAPYPLPQMGLNAIALRFVNYLTDETILIPINGFSGRFPHPARFALHKLLIGPRRKNKEKEFKDLYYAFALLEILIQSGQAKEIKKHFDQMPNGWKKTLKNFLSKKEETKKYLAFL